MIPQDTVNRILDAAQIVDVRSTMRRLLRFRYLLPREYSNVSVAESPARP